MPTGKIPVLEVHENGHVFRLSQSIAIGTYSLLSYITLYFINKFKY